MRDPSAFLRRRARSTFFTSLFSISFVLLFLCVFLGLAMFARKTLQMVQEEFQVMIVLSEDVTGERELELENKIRHQAFARDVKFVNKEEAAEEFMNAVGKDFLDIMEGFNPMRSYIQLQLKANYQQEDSLKAAKEFLQNQPGVVELVSPDKAMVKIYRNASFIINVSIILSAFMALIAWFLIGGTIRLSVFARRFSIRTMQLIGASNRFIRRPFLAMGIIQGFTGGVIAVSIYILILWSLPFYFSDLEVMASVNLIREGLFITNGEGRIMLGGIIIFGALLGWIASSFAVNRFLNQPLENIA